MSNNVDERSVKLTFENDKFEQGVGKSLGSLEKLNKSLDFTNKQQGGKGLEQLSQTVKATDFSEMANNVEQVSNRFSKLGIIGMTALQNITNKAVNAGTNLAKSLTIAPIKQGFDEYELKMNSVRTIMASTGASIGEVNGYLNELNKYADDTIYSFSDMTNNIGKFTNAGVKLEDAVSAIKGISNEAAVSGANANEASRAMYNFSQALSAGYVKLIDWKSIENANMATKEFKQQLLETALAIGTVTKKNGEYITTTTDAKGKVSEAFTSTKAFNESLTHQWMTTDVLTKTLRNYSTDVKNMKEEELDAYKSKLKAEGYTKKQIDSIIEVGKKATASAREVTTFSKLIDTLQEAVGSGWAMTFEHLFGDLNEAKNLWTSVNDVVSGFIGRVSDSRNALLKTWKDAGGRTAVLNGMANVLKYIGSLLKPIGTAFRAVFPPASGQALADASKKFEELTKKLKPSEATLRNVRDAFIGVFSVIKLVKDTVVGLVQAILPAGSAGGSLAKTFFALAGAAGRVISSIVTLIQKSGIIQFILAGIQGIVKFVTSALSGLANTIEEVLTPMVDKMSNSGEGNPFTKLADGLDKVGKSSTALGSAIKPVKDLGSSITELASSKSFEGIKEGFANAFGNIEAGGMATVLFQVLKVVGLAVLVKKAVSKFGRGGLLDTIKKPFLATAGTIEQLKDVFSSIGDSFLQIGGILKSAKRNIQYQSFKIIATSILLLATAVYLLSRISVSDMKKALIALTYISVLMIAVTKIASSGDTNAATLAAVAASFVAISLSLNIVAIAAKIFASMSVADLLKAGIAIAAFVLGISKLTTVAKGSIRGALSFAIVAGSIGLGLSLLIPAIVLLANMKTTSMIKAGVAIVGFITLISRAASLAGKDKISVVQFIGISLALSVLVPAILALANLPFTGALKAAFGIALIVAAIGQSARLVSKDKISIISFLVISAGINLIAPAIVALSQLPLAGALKAAIMLGATLQLLTMAVSKLNQGGKGSLINAVIFVALSVAVRILASALYALSTIPFAGLIKATAALIVCLGSLALAGKLASKMKKNILLLALLMTLLAGAIKIIASIDFASSGGNMAGLSSLLISVSVAAYLLSKIPFSSAIAAIGKFAIFLASITIVIAALGAIASKFENFEEYLKKGAKIGGYIGEFIGSFIGGVVGGFIGAASSGLLALGKNLSAFMVSLKPFLNGVESISPETANSVKNLAKAILYLTAADLLNALNSSPIDILTGNGGGMVKFAKQLGLFIEAIKPVGEKSKDIPNLETLNKVSKTITTLGKAAMNIPSVGGIDGLIHGVHDLGKFGKQLGDFVSVLSSMKEDNFKMGKTDLGSILNIAKAVKSLGQAANEMPETIPGMKSVIYGVKDIGEFANQLVAFAPQFSSFVGTIKGQDSNIDGASLKLVMSLANAVKALANAANAIPENLAHDSIDAAINGIKDMPRFASGLESLIGPLKGIVAASADLDKGAVSKVKMLADIIKAVAGAAGKIQESKDKAGLLGEGTTKLMNDLGKFTDKLSGKGGFISKFKSFAKQAGGIGAKNLKAGSMVAKAANSLAQAGKAMSKTKGGISTKNFEKLANGAKKFVEGIKNLKTDGIDKTASEIKKSITSLAKGLKQTENFKASGKSAIKAYYDALGSKSAKGEAKDAGNAVAKSARTNLAKDFKKKGLNAGKHYANGIKEKKSSAKKAGSELRSSVKDGLKGKNGKDAFTQIGEDIGNGIIKGLENKSGAVYDAAYKVGQQAAKGAKKGAETNSPSKLTIPVGESIGEGLIVGMQAMRDKIFKKGKTIGLLSTEAVNAGIEDIADPSITPVLDLSSIKRGVGKMDSMLNGTSATIGASIAGMRTGQNGGQTEDLMTKIADLSDSIQMMSDSNNLDTNMIYEAVRQGASDAVFNITLNNRELSRGLRDMGVVFK